jgi:hypothetical protein
MPTRKTIFWLLAAAAFYLIAWNVGSGWLYILMAVMLAVPLAGLVINRFNIRGLEVLQSSPPSATQGDSLVSNIVVSNKSRFPRLLVEVDGELGGGAFDFLLPMIQGKGRREVSVKLDAVSRGVYPGGTLLISSSAPYGLAKSKKKLFSACPLVVYPQWHKLPQDWDSGQKNAGYMVSTAIATRNPASDYLGVREYRPGDSLRSIHWRTAARSGRLAVIEYARQTAMTPAVIIDTYEQGDIGTGWESTFETGITLAASIIKREEGNHRRFALGSSPSDAGDSGLSQSADRAMLWLAGVEAVRSTPLKLDQGTMPWPDATPVLILSSLKTYAYLDRSDFFTIFPSTFVIMLDGRGFEPESAEKAYLMDKSALQSLAERVEAMGGRFMLIPSPQEAGECLQRL